MPIVGKDQVGRRWVDRIGCDGVGCNDDVSAKSIGRINNVAHRQTQEHGRRDGDKVGRVRVRLLQERNKGDCAWRYGWTGIRPGIGNGHIKLQAIHPCIW